MRLNKLYPSVPPPANAKYDSIYNYFFLKLLNKPRRVKLTQNKEK